MAKYSKEKKKCETCGHEGKALIKKEFGGSEWYRCVKFKEIIGSLDDPIKDAFYNTSLGMPYR